ncbi:MAG: hypothetical protein KDN18_02585 [Verrucomicrobiae bacterium]|nr:hypothetical protein [Verrucomicrobiae bacterium]
MGLRSAIGAFFFSSLVAIAPGWAQDAPVPATDQRDYLDSPNGCAPATVLNLLKFGGTGYRPVLEGLIGSSDGVKMRFLVDRYFRLRKSTIHPAEQRWGVHGIACEDLTAGLNELLAEHGAPALSARYLDREEGETEADHLTRVCRLISRSLAEETPPILNLRSFVVKRREENGNEPKWETGASHYVLVTALRGTPSETGSELEVIDPWKGRRTVIYLHREANGRDFLALKGTLTNGTWRDDRPFLQVLAPDVASVRPANVEWSDRYLLVANHLIGRF